LKPRQVRLLRNQSYRAAQNFDTIQVRDRDQSPRDHFERLQVTPSVKTRFCAVTTSSSKGELAFSGAHRVFSQCMSTPLPGSEC
jgi:hypothetical protein